MNNEYKELTMADILIDAATHQASDIYLIGGLPLTYKIYGRQVRDQQHGRLMPVQITQLVEELYQLAQRPDHSEGRYEDDFSFGNSIARYRINTFYQRGSLSAVIRVVAFGIPNPDDLHIPATVMNLADLSKGFVLFTGATGSGKSITLACLIDSINQRYEKTIITMEDPIEFIHRHQKSIVIQREINTDTESYLAALRASFRESPDVLLVGEMRDSETIATAMTAAETGKLIFSSLHTISAADTIDRILDGFPASQQAQARMQLSRVLNCVVCQQLIPTIDGHLYPAFEIMKVTPAIRNLIREGKTYQLNAMIQEDRPAGSCLMNDSLQQLCEQKIIEPEVAYSYSDDPTTLKRKLQGGKAFDKQ